MIVYSRRTRAETRRDKEKMMKPQMNADKRRYAEGMTSRERKSAFICVHLRLPFVSGFSCRLSFEADLINPRLATAHGTL
jgi:hypothetical protein